MLYAILLCPSDVPVVSLRCPYGVLIKVTGTKDLLYFKLTIKKNKISDKYHCKKQILIDYLYHSSIVSYTCSLKNIQKITKLSQLILNKKKVYLFLNLVIYCILYT